MTNLYYKLIILLLFLSNNLLFAHDVVYIYAGPGVSKNSLIQIEKTMNLFLGKDYHIEHILPEQIINDEWENHAALLIIPGGADIPYTKALNGIGNQRIRSYVENGGSFLGICAGAYYSGNFVDFAEDTELEVRGERELSLFPGIVRGPILADYDYLNESGARAAEIKWNGVCDFFPSTIFTVYYNGGGFFVDASKKQHVSVLAHYDLGEEYAAIVECHVGFGKAILSGVHIEYDPDLLDSTDDYLKPIIESIKSQNHQRLQLIKHLLERLGV